MPPEDKLKLAEYKLNWIKERITEGKDVYLSTAYRHTIIRKKNISMLKATKTGLYLQRGKSWENHDYSKISAQ